MHVTTSTVSSEYHGKLELFFNIYGRLGHVVQIIFPARVSNSISNILWMSRIIGLMHALILGLVYVGLMVSTCLAIESNLTCYLEVIEAILEFDLPCIFYPLLERY